MKDQSQYGKTLRLGIYAVEPIRRTGLRSILEEMHGLDLVEVNFEKPADPCDVAIVSLANPTEALITIGRFRAEQPQVRIIIMSAADDEENIIAAISAGAKGYLTDTATPEEVIQAVEIVGSGSIWAPRQTLSKMVDRMLASGPITAHTSPQFTNRELEVLQLLVSARSNREIAQALGIEVRTVKSYIGRMMKKVGVGNRIALSVHAATHSLSTPERNS
jgi:DNA-binding NarL/FixJ family response regulator